MTHDEKKATEDLLAGFDRPGRSPRAPRVQNKFVDFAPPVDSRRVNETALVTRARRAHWLPWLALGLVLLMTVIGIASIALPVAEPTAKPAPSAPAIAPVTAEVPPPVVVPPPPVTAEVPPLVVVPSPPPPSIPVPSAARSSAPRPPAPPREDPRVDFVRNL